MNIRKVTPKDYNSIYTFVKTAFATAEVSDGTEQDFVVQLRQSANYLPELEFIAVNSDEIIGHIMLTRQAVNTNKPLNAVLVAPLCVKQKLRNSGIGTRLMKHALKYAGTAGFNAAFLIGSSDYYKRFGFKETKFYNIKNDSAVPDKYVLACPIQPDALSGITGSAKII